MCTFAEYTNVPSYNILTNLKLNTKIINMVNQKLGQVLLAKKIHVRVALTTLFLFYLIKCKELTEIINT